MKINIDLLSYKQRRGNEKGSVLFYILVAVVLFAALSYAVGNMMRSGNTDMVGEEQAKLSADQLLGYSNSIRGAVQDMRISNGCVDTQISFENDIVSGYTNSNAPSDESCNVFSANGGGVNWVSPQFGVLGFSGTNKLEGVGTSEAELLMIVWGVPREVCLQINSKLGVGSTSGEPPHDTGGLLSKFTGAYGTGNPLNNEDANLSVKASACFWDSDSTSEHPYIFYQTLIAR